MKLASHDTMSYLKPKNWWMYPFRFIARCLSKNIYQQYKLGIRMFDIRIKYNKDLKPRFGHGLMTYKGDVELVLNWLNSKGNVYVRIILENPKNNLCEIATFQFVHDVKEWVKKYKNITFFEGVRKHDWKDLCHFDTNISYDLKVSSTTWKIWDDWFPWLYARFMNKKNIKKGTDKDWLFIDFIQIQ